MTEKIENFTQMIENYYNKNGENYRFHFLPVRAVLKYYENAVASSGLIYRETQKTSYIVEYVPVLTKLPHSKRFIPLEEYDDVFKTGILATIDTETYLLEDADIHSKIIELIHKQFKNISKEELVKIISAEELNKIASLNGYKEFTWDIYDPYIDREWMFRDNEKLKELKDKWIYDVYGVPLISNGNIDLTFLTDEQLFGDKALDVIKKCGTSCEVTDFAYYSGGGYFSSLSDDRSRRTAPYWIKLPHMLPPISNPMYVNSKGLRQMKLPNSFSWAEVDLVGYGSRPVVSYSSIKSMAYNEKINSLGIKEIHFGEYPQTEVNEDYANELERAYSTGNPRLTRKSYTSSSRIH
jgi:hypothetical protein